VPPKSNLFFDLCTLHQPSSAAQVGLQLGAANDGVSNVPSVLTYAVLFSFF